MKLSPTRSATYDKHATIPCILVCGLQQLTCFQSILSSVREPSASLKSGCTRTSPARANHVAAHEGTPVRHGGRRSLGGCAWLLAGRTALGRLPTDCGGLPSAGARRAACFGRAPGAAAKGNGAPLLNRAAGSAAQRGSPCGFWAARPAHGLPATMWGNCLGVSCPLQLGTLLLCITAVRLCKHGSHSKALSAERYNICA